GQGMTDAPYDGHVVGRQAQGVDVVERPDLSQGADQDVDVAGSQAGRQFPPGGDDDAQPQPGMGRGETTDCRCDERGAAPWTDADAELAELQSLGQADLALEVASAGIEGGG